MNSRLREYVDTLKGFIKDSLSKRNIESNLDSSGNIVLNGMTISIDSDLNLELLPTNGVKVVYKYNSVTKLPLDSDGFKVWKCFCRDKILQRIGVETEGVDIFFDLIKDIEAKFDKSTISNTLLYPSNDVRSNIIRDTIRLLNRNEVLYEEPSLHLNGRDIWWGSADKRIAEIRLQDIDSKRTEFIEIVTNKIKNGIDAVGFVDEKFRNYSFSTFINEVKHAISRSLNKKGIEVDIDSESRFCFMLIDNIKYRIRVTNTLQIYLPKTVSADGFEVYSIDDELFDLPVKYSGINSYLSFVVDAICYNYRTLNNQDIESSNYIYLYENIKTVLGDTLKLGKLSFLIASDEKSWRAGNKIETAYMIFRTRFNSFGFFTSYGNANSVVFVNKDKFIDNDILIDVKAMNNNDGNYDEWCRRCDLIRAIIRGEKSFDDINEDLSTELQSKPSESGVDFDKNTFKGLRIVALKSDNKIIGYRFKGDNIPGYDITVEAAKKFGITSLKVKKSINLKNKNGLLLSKKEIGSGNIIEDISENSELISKLISLIKEV